MTAGIVAGGFDGPSVTERVRVQVADRLTTSLRDEANKAGWPHVVVSGIRVIWDGSTWRVDVDLRVRAYVNDLEYGTQTQPPNPVFRKFVPKMAKLAEDAAGKASMNLVGEVLR